VASCVPTLNRLVFAYLWFTKDAGLRKRLIHILTVVFLQTSPANFDCNGFWVLILYDLLKIMN